MLQSIMQRIRKKYCNDIPEDSIEYSHHKIRKVSYVSYVI